MRDLSIMIKPASSMCNMRCKYCFYEDLSEHRKTKSHGVMSPTDMESMLKNIFCCMDAGDRITFAFQGGEPTLAGLDFFQAFVSAVRRLNCGCEIEYQLQTNGIVLDHAWCEFLKQEKFLVGLSIDGTKEIHDRNRIDRAGNGTFEAVMKAKRLLDQYEIPYNALMTMTNEMAEHAGEVWEFIQEERFEYVQFTPCLGVLEAQESCNQQEHQIPMENSELHPEAFARFYLELFPLWTNRWKKKHDIVIKLFDDLITLLATGSVTACGLTGTCTPQIIVEANGDVFPCDFYALDEYRIGNLCRETIKEVYESPKRSSFSCIPHAHQHLCGSCRFRRICGGNCKRMQVHICYGDGYRNCGYQMFLAGAIQELLGIVRELR